MAIPIIATIARIEFFTFPSLVRGRGMVSDPSTVRGRASCIVVLRRRPPTRSRCSEDPGANGRKEGPGFLGGQPYAAPSGTKDLQAEASFVKIGRSLP